MAEAEQALTNEDIVRMDLDEIKRSNRPIDIDKDELSFPSMAHHMTVRGKLEALVDKGVLSFDEVESLYKEWKETKQ